MMCIWRGNNKDEVKGAIESKRISSLSKHMETLAGLFCPEGSLS